MHITLLNSGFSEEIEVPDPEIADVHAPLLRQLAELAEGGRAIVLLAGPPGSGKGLLSAVWQRFGEDRGTPILTLSMDGFHYPNEYLRERDLLAVKGSPETFDVRALSIALAQLRAGTPLVWPVYDRNTHEPRADGVPVGDEPIILIEGNYFLLDEPHWASLRRHVSMTIHVEVDRKTLRERIVARHIRGGMSAKEAEAKFLRSDLKNILRVEERSVAADRVLLWDGERGYRLLEGGERTL